jgi:hypothetical protein
MQMTLRFRGLVSALSLSASVIFSCAVAPAGATEGLAVGACVSVTHQPGPARIVMLTPGGYVVQAAGKARSEALNWARSDVVSGPCPGAPTKAQLAQPHKCFPSDADGAGGAAQRSDRNVIRRTLTHTAPADSDGTVTIHFQSFRTGANRRWLRSDGYNFASDQSKPIHELRVVFTLCTDYRTAIQLRQQERNFECFTAPTQEHVCQESGSTGGMMPDKSQYIPKN